LSETDARHRYVDTASTSPAAPNSSLDAGYELSMEFVRLQKFIGRVSFELHGKYESGGLVAEDRTFNIPTDAVFVTMLNYLMTSGKQSASLDLPSQMMSYSRALRQVTDCIEVVDNLTLSQQLVKTLMSPWQEIPHRLVLAKGNNTSQVMETLDLCRQQFASSSNSKGDTGADPVSVVDSMIRQYMNRTLETVSQLSHTVQTTLDRMKTLPEELFAENKTAKKISRRLTDAVNKLNTKVQSGWKHVASKFEDVRKRWFGYSESKTCKHKKREEHKKHTKKNGDVRFTGKPFTELGGKFEDKKRTYKQTKSAPAGKGNTEYGPPKHADDLLHSSQLDDFFEDIHRSWRQHNNRRLRKVGSYIERLNEEMFLSMDDDDVEDIYKDLKDVGEDMEKRDSTDDFRTWISCQLRWWKTRIHRKHRAEDLVKGCGRQLMHWQLRVLCKEEKSLIRSLPYRRLCDTVMPIDDPINILYASADLKSSVKMEDLSELVLTNDTCSDSEWYFRRVQDREDRRQLSPQWYFDRVEDRHFSRGDANWYVRAMRHSAALSPVAGTDHPHQSDGNVKGNTGQI